MNDSLLKLVNPVFKIEFDGKEHEVRKANIEKVVQYQQRAKKLNDDAAAGGDAQLVAYALFLVLKEAIPELTEDEVLQKTPGDLDSLEVLTTLGFVSPAKIQAALKMIVEAAKNTTTPDSSATSLTEPAGPQA